MSSLDSFKAQKTLKVGGKTYVYYSLAAAEKNGLKGISSEDAMQQYIDLIGSLS